MDNLPGVTQSSCARGGIKNRKPLVVHNNMPTSRVAISVAAQTNIGLRKDWATHCVATVMSFLILLFPAHAWSAQEDFSWSRSFSETGFRNGHAADVRSGRLTAFWPIPDPLRAGHGILTLDLATVATRDFSGQIEIFVDGTPRATLTPRPGAHSDQISLPLSAPTLADGLVQVTIAMRESWERRDCSGVAPGLSFSLQAESAISLVPGVHLNARERIQLLPATFFAKVPTGPIDLAEYRNITVIAASLSRSGHRAAFAADGQASPALIFDRGGWEPQIGEDGALHIPATRAMADAFAAQDDLAFPFLPHDDPAVPLTALGLTPQVAYAMPDAQWSFAVPLRAVPAGLSPRELIVELTAPVDGEGARQSLALEVNDEVVASELLALRGGPRRVALEIPRGALNAGNSMRLVLRRVGLRGACAGSPLPVTVGATSMVALGPAGPVPMQFFELAHLSPEGTVLQVDTALLADPGRSLGLAVSLVTATVRDLRTLTIAPFGGARSREDGPFLALSTGIPPGLATDTVPAYGPDATFALLVRAHGAYGIWLHPGTRVDPTAVLPPLERGRFATFDAQGDVRWVNGDLSARRAVMSAQSDWVARVVQRYWPWTAALIWIVLSAGLLIALARRKSGR